MNLLLAIAEQHIPVGLRKKELNKLFQLTASAFGCTTPALKGMDYQACLRHYALFTKRSVYQLGEQEERMARIRQQLFQQAFQYGQGWRKKFGLSTMSEVMRAAKVLYRAIGIEFKGNEQGDIEIDRCFFSHYYTSATCWVISALDSGLMAGLAGGGKLSFSQRITEGATSCRAKFE